MIQNSLKSYKKKTKKSSELFKKSKKLHVNGVHHNIRFFDPYPFIVKSSKGKFLIDVDSNKYVDYWMGHWSLILGHSPKNVRNNVKVQLENGWMHGTASKNAIELSEKFLKLSQSLKKSAIHQPARKPQCMLSGLLEPLLKEKL